MGKLQRVGFSGEIADYRVVSVGDEIRVYDRVTGEEIARRIVEKFGHFLDNAIDLKMTLAFFSDFQVIYIFDYARDCWGYAVNLQVEEFSEWGTCPTIGGTP